ncbi:MAG: molecular chaperone DnaJ [Actinomycetia bacterium]|nr:molecular chaperone DnaJ [Actinomycetes bacterium]MCP4959279.1 molecular chaperone DnaJ [Actinomycetes bacterium]
MADVSGDYYELLGVSREATPDEMKKAYRRLARQLHPDANPDDPEAEAHFKEVSKAYAVLSDPEKRASYDRFGEEGVGAGFDPFGGQGFGSINDIFDMFFGGQSPFGGSAGGRGRPGGPPRGADQEVVATLTFEEAVFGAEMPISLRTALRCETCAGSGAAEGTSASTCGTCSGSGQVRQVRQSILGQMVTSGVCPECNGQGTVIPDPCLECSGEGRTISDEELEVRVPPGVNTGSTLRLTGRGAVGPRGGPPGDLYVHVQVQGHDRFQRDGDHLFSELEISLAQATLGVDIDFETLDGTEKLEIRAGTQPGEVLRLRGLGVTRLEGRGRGDLHISLRVLVPKRLPADQEQLIRELAEMRGESVKEPDEGFMSKIKSAFR